MTRPQAAHRPPHEDYVEVDVAAGTGDDVAKVLLTSERETPRSYQAIALARPDLVGKDAVRHKPLALPFEVQCDLVEAPAGPMAAMARMLDAEQAEIVAN